VKLNFKIIKISECKSPSSSSRIVRDCNEENINKLLMNTIDPEYHILSNYDIVCNVFKKDNIEGEGKETDNDMMIHISRLIVKILKQKTKEIKHHSI